MQQMDSAFSIWKSSRNIFSRFLDKYSPEQLNTIPAGFSNNLIWNIGHVIVVQQGLIYKGSGLERNVPEEMVERYNIGSKPTQDASQQEIEEMKDLVLSLVDSTIKDYNVGKFKEYHSRTTSTGFHLGAVSDAIVFNNFHEGLHLGYMMSIRKFVKA